MKNKFEQYFDEKNHELDIHETVNDEDIVELSTFLDDHKDQIKTLRIESDFFDPELLEPLKTAIENCKNLSVFGIKNIYLMDTLLNDLQTALSDKKLQSFSIYGYNCDSLAIENLITAIVSSDLEHLSISVRFLQDETLKGIAGAITGSVPKLKSLEIASEIISDDGLACLIGIAEKLKSTEYDFSPPPKLESFSFISSNITDTGATLLANFITKLPTLTALYIQGNRITDLGIDAIADAIHGKLKIDSQEQAEPLTKLEMLKIQSESISNEKLSAFANTFEPNKVYLYLKNKEATIRRFKIYSLADHCIFAIKKNEALLKQAMQPNILPAELIERISETKRRPRPLK